jgi:hypothetical protein
LLNAGRYQLPLTNFQFSIFNNPQYLRTHAHPEESERHRTHPSFFLFFSGAGLARLSNCPPAAPQKNKKNGGGSRSSYKQVTPDGVFGPWRTSAAGRKHEIQVVCIN